MAKYNWQELEKEFILGDYKSINSFFKEKGISRNQTSNRETKDWKEKKQQRNIQKTAKTIEKVTDKESTKEANDIVKLNDVAIKLLNKINNAIEELNISLVTSKTKKEKTKYDSKALKPSEKEITEEVSINKVETIIDKNGLKQLTSSLKDLNDILNSNNNDSNANNEKVVIVDDL